MYKRAILFILLSTTAILADVTTDSPRTTHSCNGSSTEFTFDFSIDATSEIVVILRTTATGDETVLTETTHYSVSATNNDYSSGGTVTTVATYGSTYTLTILRDTDQDQDASLEDTGVLRLRDLQEALDKLTRLVQELQEEIDRCVKIPRTESSTVMSANSVDRASSYPYWDASGNLSDVASVASDNTVVSSWGEGLVGAATSTAAMTVLDLDDHTHDVNVANLEVTTTAEAGTVEAANIYTSTNPLYNVKHSDYGALGNNSDDDTAAIQAAIDAAEAANGGTIFFPAGTYQYTALTVDAATNRIIHFVGADRNLAVLRHMDTGVGITWAVSHGSIKRMEFRGNDTETSTLKITGDRNHIEDCQFAGGNSPLGLDLNTAISTSVDNCYFNDYEGGWAVVIENASNATSMTNCQVRLNLDGIKIDDSDQVCLWNCVIESNTDDGILVTGTSYGCDLRNLWFESNDGTDLEFGDETINNRCVNIQQVYIGDVVDAGTNNQIPDYLNGYVFERVTANQYIYSGRLGGHYDGVIVNDANDTSFVTAHNMTDSGAGITSSQDTTEGDTEVSCAKLSWTTSAVQNTSYAQPDNITGFNLTDGQNAIISWSAKASSASVAQAARPYMKATGSGMTTQNRYMDGITTEYTRYARRIHNDSGSTIAITVRFYVNTVPGSNFDLYIDDVMLQIDERHVAPYFENDDAATALTSRLGMGCPAGFIYGETKHYWGGAAPTIGTWQVGDIVWNDAPATTEWVGWICTVAGTPGTWLGFGVIE